MYKRILLIGLISVVGMACEKTDEIICFAGPDESPLITIGRVCGWCVPADSLVISETKLWYGFDTPCNNNDFLTQKETDIEKWNTLIELLDMDKFSEIDVNSCNVCADGCDTWVTVKTENEFHKIRFGYGDSSKIKTVQPFVDHLEAWIGEFRDR